MEIVIMKPPFRACLTFLQFSLSFSLNGMGLISVSVSDIALVFLRSLPWEKANMVRLVHSA